MKVAPGIFLENRTRLNFISGKGGVGKTTISCALALKASRSGQETLLFAINPTLQLETFFGIRPYPGEGPHQILPRLWVHNLDQQELFDEFIRDSLKIRRVYEAVLASQVYQYFTAIAPGIKELFTQELIVESLQRLKRFDRRYFDIILIDSPATGHGLSWFSVPDAVMSTFPVGPLNKKAKEIKRIWLDPDLSSIHLATLPEEMPVNETIHYYKTLTEKLHFPVKNIFLNCMYQGLNGECEHDEINDLISGKPDELIKVENADLSRLMSAIRRTARFYRNRRDLNRYFREEILKAVSLPLIEIPMIFERDLSPLELLESVGERL